MISSPHYLWKTKLPPPCIELFEEAVQYAEKKPATPTRWTGIFDLLSAPPGCPITKKEFAQFFTPPDVALYAAFNLLENYRAGIRVFDPCVGHGSLLIAAMLVLATKYGMGWKAILPLLRGSEIDAATRLSAIENVSASLHLLFPEASIDVVRVQIASQIVLSDCNDIPLETITGASVITNPPYKEGKTGNLWIPIIERLLSAAPYSISMILPVSIASSKRVAGIRTEVTARFNRVLVLHHEIRPRPLFRNVDQRISIVTALNAPQSDAGYFTTEFIRHRAGSRQTVWNAPQTRLDFADLNGSFPKVGPDDMSFYREFVDGNRTPLCRILGEPSTDVWVRTTGRYSLRAQEARPGTDEISTKWKKLDVPRSAVSTFVSAFADGDLLRWWRIFGDGRDISITALQTAYGIVVPKLAGTGTGNLSPK